MPRFFFNIIDGNVIIKDPDGSDLPDLETAREEAIQSARHLLAARLKAGAMVDGQRFEVRDAEGVLRAIVPFRDAFRLN